MHGPVELALSTCTAVTVYAQCHRRRRHKARPGQVAGIHAREATSTRTPSFGGSARDRRPSMSGGYGRPTSSMPSRSGSAWSLPRSASDQALARQSSREALDSLPSAIAARGLLTSAFDRVVWAVGWAAATRPGAGRRQGGPRGLVWPFGMVTPVLCRPHPAPVWHVGCDVRVVSPRYPVATRACGLLPSSCH